ncbi:uncharacterized protein LOC117109114 isoform X2 [Anneissia japonica]|uniref:uncharacterized protein LOC117109114 isoform X2 n=1 Tax=Anneissia japonica TaxID=1529436 RepID=UPI0014255932|nr:uncharacterized protein LOC117109114 isoform X2 [Anneissia japonica]
MLPADGKHQPGLQVASVIGSAFRTLLGPSKSVKFFVEQDELESVSITSTRELLQLLDTQHPIGEMIASAVQTHDNVYGCYSTTMVVLLGYWCQEFKNLMIKGYPISSMLAVGDELLEFCINVVQKSSISLTQIMSHQLEGRSNDSYLCQARGMASCSNIEVIGKVYDPGGEIKRKETGMMTTSDPDGITQIMKASNGSTEKTLKNCGKEIYQGYMIPTEREKNSWSTYQDIMEDQDVSWFFTDENKAEQTDLQILPEVSSTDTLRMIQCEDHQDFVNAIEDYDVLGLGTLCDEHLKLSDVATLSVTSSQISKNLTEMHSLKTLSNDFVHSELQRNSSNLPHHVAKLIERQELVCKDPDSDNEFAGCFDNLPNVSQDEIFSQRGTKLDQPVSGTVSMEDNNCPSVYFQGYTKKLEINEILPKAQQNLTVDIDSLIEKKIKESSKFSLLKGMSHSRHFRTIKNTDNEVGKIQNDEFIAETQQSDDKKLSEVNINSFINRKVEETREMRTDRVQMQSQYIEIEQHQEISKPPSDNVQSAVGRTFRCIDDRIANVGSKDNERNQTADHKIKSVSKLMIVDDASQQNVDDPLEQDQKSFVELVDLLGPALSYDSEQAMKIAMQMFKSTTREILKVNVNTKWLHICSMLGPPSSESRVEAGLILPTTSHQVPLVTVLKQSQPKLLLISGDVQPRYHHLGYKESLKPEVIVKSASTVHTSQKHWKQKVLDLLKQLNISILVTKGTVDSSLCADCLAENVLVVQQVKYSALKKLSGGSGANILTYILDAEEVDVGSVSSLNTLEGGQTKGQGSTSLCNQSQFVRIETESSIQTAVLCAPSQPLLDGLEEQFMSCIHRLTQAFVDEKVIPGAGYTEIVAINNLNNLTETTDLVDRHDIAKALQSGWESYLLQLVYNCRGINDWSQGMDYVAKAVHMNTSPCGCDVHRVVDCVTAKVAAWKTAWKLLGIILLTDTHISTGLDDNVL